MGWSSDEFFLVWRAILDRSAGRSVCRVGVGVGVGLCVVCASVCGLEC